MLPHSRYINTQIYVYSICITALHMAAAGGYASLISVLVHDFGAIDLPNHIGVTAEQLSRNEVVRMSFNSPIV